MSRTWITAQEALERLEKMKLKSKSKALEVLSEEQLEMAKRILCTMPKGFYYVEKFHGVRVLLANMKENEIKSAFEIEVTEDNFKEYDMIFYYAQLSHVIESVKELIRENYIPDIISVLVCEEEVKYIFSGSDYILRDSTPIHVKLIYHEADNEIFYYRINSDIGLMYIAPDENYKEF